MPSLATGVLPVGTQFVMKLTSADSSTGVINAEVISVCV